MGLEGASPQSSTSLEQAEVQVDLTLYSESVVFRASHEFTGQCYVNISRSGDDNELCVRFIKQHAGVDLGQVKREFANALLDHRVREELERTAGPLRRVIVAQAFAEADFRGGSHENSTDDAGPTV